jgi:hypothetical protein
MNRLPAVGSPRFMTQVVPSPVWKLRQNDPVVGRCAKPLS